MNAKRVLDTYAGNGLLTVLGDMDVIPILSEEEEDVAQASHEQFTQVGEQYRTNPVDAVLSVARTKLNQLQAEQTKVEARRKSVSEMEAAPEDKGFSVEEGLQEMIQSDEARRAVPRRRSRERARTNEDKANLLTGYVDEERDARVRIRMTAEQHSKTLQHVSLDAGLGPGCKQRGMIVFASDATTRGGVTITHDVADSLLMPHAHADDTEVAQLHDVLTAQANRFLEAVPRRLPLRNVRGKGLDALQEMQTQPTYVPEDMYDTEATMASIVLWRQTNGSVISTPPLSKDAALERLHAALVDAYQRVMSHRYRWHEGPHDGWYLQNISGHLVKAGLQGIYIPQYHIISAVAAKEFSYEDLGAQERIFPYPSQPSGGSSQSTGSSRKSTRLSRMSKVPQGSTSQHHIPLDAMYAGTLNADLLSQISELPLCRYLSEAYGSSGDDYEARVVALALLAETQGMRTTYSTIVQRCMPSQYMLLLVTQLLSSLVLAFKNQRQRTNKPLTATPPADWYNNTWLDALRHHPTHAAALQPLAEVGVVQRVLGLFPSCLGAGVEDVTLKDLLFLATEHPCHVVRSTSVQLLRQCKHEVLGHVLLQALRFARDADEHSIRDVWTEDPTTDERHTSSVSGHVGALCLALSACFPDLSREVVVCGQLEVMITQLRDSQRADWVHTDAEGDAWDTQRAADGKEGREAGRQTLSRSLRFAIKEVAGRVPVERLEMFCAVRRISRETGGRAARVVSLALLKLWSRRARMPDSDEARLADEGTEEAADLMHILRDCLDPGDSIGLIVCIRALPAFLLKDRGSAATVLHLALSHECNDVRSEAAKQCLLLPTSHHAWAADQLARTLAKNGDVPFIFDAIIECCPRLPPRPPPELLKLVVRSAQTGHQASRLLLQRSPIFEATVLMAKEGDGGANWVLQSLPPFEGGCSTRLVEQMAGSKLWLREEVVRAACRRGDERVAQHLLGLLRRGDTTGDEATHILDALPDFAYVPQEVVSQLFILACSTHAVASHIQDLLREGVTTMNMSDGRKVLIDRRSPAGCRRRVAAVAGLVVENLPHILQHDDTHQTTSMIGTLRSAPRTEYTTPYVEDVLQQTWQSRSLGCRQAAQAFFSFVEGGQHMLLSYLTDRVLAYARRHQEEYDGLEEVFMEVEVLGGEWDSAKEDDTHSGSEQEPLEGSAEGSVPDAEQNARRRASELKSEERRREEEDLVRVLQAFPGDLTHADMRLLETIVIYAIKHVQEDVRQVCVDIVQSTAVSEVLNLVESYIQEDTGRPDAIRLLPKNIARASQSLLKCLIKVATTHHEASSRSAAQKVLRLNLSTTASLPLLLARELNHSSSHPSDQTVALLLCIDGTNLPRVLLQPLCTLLSHNADEVAAAAYAEAAKVPSANPDVLKELMGVVATALEPRLTAAPPILLVALLRVLHLVLLWNLNDHIDVEAVQRLLAVTTMFPCTEQSSLALQILRRAPKAYAKLCLRFLMAQHGVDDPQKVGLGLPELPSIKKGDEEVNLWDYNRLLAAITPAVLERGEPWALDLAKRSPVLGAMIGAKIKPAVHELPCADTAPTMRQGTLQRAALAMRALPDLDSLRLSCASAVEAGRLIDAVCQIADGFAEDDVLHHLRGPARGLLLPST